MLLWNLPQRRWKINHDLPLRMLLILNQHFVLNWLKGGRLESLFSGKDFSQQLNQHNKPLSPGNLCLPLKGSKRN